MTLVPGSGGVFEIAVDDETVFAKHREGRFPDPNEIERALERILGCRREDPANE